MQAYGQSPLYKGQTGSKRKKKQASRLDKAISRMRQKVKHLQSELHKKSVAFFTREFDAVIIPPFEMSNMVNRKTRKITRKTVRKMLCWGHYPCYYPKRGLNLQLVWERSKNKRVRDVQVPELCSNAYCWYVTIHPRNIYTARRVWIIVHNNSLDY